MTFEQPKQEKEQTPEEIRRVMEIALKEGRHVDLVIVNSDCAKFTPDLIVEELDNEYAMMTYIAEDGDVGELIPLKLARIKKAELRDDQKDIAENE
ncbi:MAG: hypothetical protein V1867_06865 [Candidatus Falkowbacteria bacterium]